MSAVNWLRVRGIDVLLAEGEGGADLLSSSASRREAGSDMDDKMGRRCSMLQGWRGGWGYVYKVNPSALTDLPRVSDEEWAGCLGVVHSMRVAIFVVAYNAEAQ